MKNGEQREKRFFKIQPVFLQVFQDIYEIPIQFNNMFNMYLYVRCPKTLTYVNYNEIILTGDV